MNPNNALRNPLQGTPTKGDKRVKSIRLSSTMKIIRSLKLRKNVSPKNRGKSVRRKLNLPIWKKPTASNSLMEKLRVAPDVTGHTSKMSWKDQLCSSKYIAIQPYWVRTTASNVKRFIKIGEGIRSKPPTKQQVSLILQREDRLRKKKAVVENTFVTKDELRKRLTRQDKYFSRYGYSHALSNTFWKTTLKFAKHNFHQPIKTDKNARARYDVLHEKKFPSNLRIATYVQKDLLHLCTEFKKSPYAVKQNLDYQYPTLSFTPESISLENIVKESSLHKRERSDEDESNKWIIKLDNRSTMSVWNKIFLFMIISCVVFQDDALKRDYPTIYRQNVTRNAFNIQNERCYSTVMRRSMQRKSMQIWKISLFGDAHKQFRFGKFTSKLLGDNYNKKYKTFRKNVRYTEEKSEKGMKGLHLKCDNSHTKFANFC